MLFLIPEVIVHKKWFGLSKMWRSLSARTHACTHAHTHTHTHTHHTKNIIHRNLAGPKRDLVFPHTKMCPSLSPKVVCPKNDLACPKGPNGFQGLKAMWLHLNPLLLQLYISHPGPDCNCVRVTAYQVPEHLLTEGCSDDLFTGALAIRFLFDHWEMEVLGVKLAG